MKKIFTLAIISLSIISTSSCNNDDETTTIESNDLLEKNEIKSFKKSDQSPIPLPSKLALLMKKSSNSESEYTFIHELNGNDKKIEEIFSGSVLMISNDYKKLYLFNKYELNSYAEYDLVYDEIKKGYKPVFNNQYINENLQNKTNDWTRYLCAAKCGVEAAMIAAADGPSPALDVIAIAYAYTCGSKC